MKKAAKGTKSKFASQGSQAKSKRSKATTKSKRSKATKGQTFKSSKAPTRSDLKGVAKKAESVAKKAAKAAMVAAINTAAGELSPAEKEQQEGKPTKGNSAL